LAEKEAAARNHVLATLPPSELLREKPTNYRRWWNNSWYEVEEGGQPKAGEWTEASEARLHALVDYAHSKVFGCGSTRWTVLSRVRAWAGAKRTTSAHAPPLKNAGWRRSKPE
jgi:hypothetical protein